MKHLEVGCIGNLPETVELPWGYFESRGCFLDCRGPLIISAKSTWGFFIRVLTESHDIGDWPSFGRAIPYGVTVEDGAWIGSGSLLAGCLIGVGAIVAAGSVVRGQMVAPGVMVAGNPARVIAQRDGKTWLYVDPKACGYERTLDKWPTHGF